MDVSSWLANGFFFFLEVIIWTFHVGRARHPGPGPRVFTPGQLSTEFVNVGGWLTHGDLALDSCAQFLAVAEHKLIPSKARSVSHQLRKASHQSVWALACQDQVAGGHAGVGVVSLGGEPLSLPSFITPQFKEFFRLGRALRTTLPTGKGGVVHLFVVYGFHVAEEDADQPLLTDKLLQAVLAEAQVVCIGQPLLIAGDLNADPSVIPCLSKGISAGRYVDLALAYSWGAGLTPDATCRSSREEGTGSRRDFFVGSSVVARFCIDAWMADVACPIVCQPISPACWLDTPDRSSSSATRAVQEVRFLGMSFLLFGMLSLAQLLMIFGLFGVKNAEEGFGPTLEPEDPLKLAVLPFLAEVCYVFVAGVWEAGLSVAGDLVGYIGLVRVMRLMCIVPSTLLIPLSLLLYSLVDASSLLRMCSRVSGIRVFLSGGGMLFWVTGELYVGMVHVVPSLPLVPEIGGFRLICTVSTGGFLIPLSC